MERSQLEKILKNVMNGRIDSVRELVRECVAPLIDAGVSIGLDAAAAEKAAADVLYGVYRSTPVIERRSQVPQRGGEAWLRELYEAEARRRLEAVAPRRAATEGGRS